MSGWEALLPDYTVWQWSMIVLAFLLAGAVKGAIGFGVPIIVISLLSVALPVREAIALGVLPAFVGNLAMMREGGRVREILARFWPLLLSQGVFMVIGAVLLTQIPTQAVLVLLGVVVITFTLSAGHLPTLTLRPRQEKAAGLGLGVITGLLAGTTTIFGPPTIMYMTALRLDRATYVAAIGTLWTLTNVMIMGAFGATEILTLPLLLASLPMAPVLMVGYPAGRWLRLRVAETTFRRLIMAGLFVSGARLIITGLF